MTTLLYRGQSYVQHKTALKSKECIELTYRREHYNTCRDRAAKELDPSLAYRGINYAK